MLRLRAVRLALALTLALALALPGLAQEGVTSGDVGPVRYTAEIALENGTGEAPVTSVGAGEHGSVRFTFLLDEGAPNATANVSVDLATVVAGLEWTGETARVANVTRGDSPILETFPFRVATNATGTVTIPFTLTAGNVTETGTLDVAVAAPQAPPPGPGPRVSPVLIGLIVLAVLGGAFAVARARRPKAKPRSATLQRMEMERQVERARTVEEKEEIQEAIAEQEAEKSEARDLQILKAKRTDAEKKLELLARRLESRQITQLQHDKMAEKRRAEIADIDRQIGEIE